MSAMSTILASYAASSMAELMARFGGKPLVGCDGTSEDLSAHAYNFGYLPSQRLAAPGDPARDDVAEQQHGIAVASMPRFQITGTYKDREKSFLWDYAKKANNGQHFLAFRQVTGSCVGNGLGQAIWYLSAMEVERLGDPEQVLLPFYLLPYGRSRFYGGLRGRGEGSFGSAAARAAREDGILPFDVDGLPKPDMSDGITWGRAAELEWSDGAAIAPRWLERSRKHLIRSTAQIRNADEAAEALFNCYPLTIASDWGGQMRPQVKDGVLLNRRVTTWMHQMCVIGVWQHPVLGLIFYVLNSWGPNTHGICPSGAPPGGFWITKADMDYICRQMEAFVLSQFNGFPAMEFSWKQLA